MFHVCISLEERATLLVNIEQEVVGELFDPVFMQPGLIAGQSNDATTECLNAFINRSTLV